MGNVITNAIMMFTKAFVVWLIWNDFIVELFTIRRLDYMEAVVLLILCQTLFTNEIQLPEEWKRKN